MLTQRQEEILRFVREHQRVQRVPPSTRAIARRFGVSQPTVIGHLQALARKGSLEKLADGRWGERGGAGGAPFLEAPVYGSIPAGLPAMREQEIEETVRFDPALFGIGNVRPPDLWLLRVAGDSMVGAGLFDGDLVVLVRREAKPGEIVAALVDDTTTTLKRLVRARGRLLLRAENPRYPDLAPQRLEIQGVAVGAIRRALP